MESPGGLLPDGSALRERPAPKGAKRHLYGIVPAIGFLLALVASPLLIGISALASPEWRSRNEILRAAQQKAVFDTPQARGLYALIALGVSLGIPAALGLMPVNVLVLLASLVACMVGRGYLTRRSRGRFAGPEMIWDPPSGWFVVLSWCILTLPLHVDTFDLGQVLAVQAVLGPATITLGPAGSSAAWAALVVGLVAATAWSGALPTLARPDYQGNQAIDSITRWGESALAATAVTGTVWGPSLGALVRGPLNMKTFLWAGISFALTMIAVAGVSFCRRYVNRIPHGPAALGAGTIALTAMIVASFIR